MHRGCAKRKKQNENEDNSLIHGSIMSEVGGSELRGRIHKNKRPELAKATPELKKSFLLLL